MDREIFDLLLEALRGAMSEVGCKEGIDYYQNVINRLVEYNERTLTNGTNNSKNTSSNK